MSRHRIASIGVLLAILFYGFFKVWFCRKYSIAVVWALEFFDFSADHILELLNVFSLTNREWDHFLGWFIYYPSYLLFHLIFIFILFYKKKNVRNRVAIALVILVSLLVIIIVISKFYDFMIVYKISYKLFQNLFGLPFILLAIEGGKILIKDIDSLVRRVKI